MTRWLVPALITATIAIGQIASATAAGAQSPVCRQLFAQAKQGDAAPAASNRAIRRDLQRTLAQADRRGCFGGFFRARGKGKGCGQLMSRIERLEQMMKQPARTARNARSGMWVERELARNGCLDRAPSGIETASAPAPDSSGGLRTVCVRSCDGYFFPMGASQSRGDISRDRERCKGLYGSAAAELYSYPAGGDPAEMVSATGEAYKNQSFAFLFQREFRPACQAELQRGFSRVRDNFLTVAGREAFKTFKTIPIPVPRPDINAADGTQAASLQTAPAPAPKTVSRIVGPLAVYDSSHWTIGDAGAPAATRHDLGSGLITSLLDVIAPPANASAAE